MLELMSQKLCFDNVDSPLDDKQRPDSHSMQLITDAAESSRADLYSSTAAEQDVGGDNRLLQRLPSGGVKSVTRHSRDVTTVELEDGAESLQFSERPETSLSEQLMTPDEGVVIEQCTVEHAMHTQSDSLVQHGDQYAALADGTGNGNVRTEYQMSDATLLASHDKSKREYSKFSVTDMNEDHVLMDTGVRRESKLQETGSTEEPVPEIVEDEPAELAFAENIHAAEVVAKSPKTVISIDDSREEKTTAVQAALSEVCSEDEPTAQEAEPRPVDLPELSDLALTAVVDDVPPQKELLQVNTSSAYTVSFVDPDIYQLSAELVAYDFKVCEMDKVQLEASECGQFAEATTKLPERERGIHKTSVSEIFDESVEHSRSPDTMTLHEVEISTVYQLQTATVQSTVEMGEREAGAATSAEQEMRIGDDWLPGTEVQRDETTVRSDNAVRHKTAPLPEMQEAAASPIIETYVESEEFPAAEFAQLPETELWMYTPDDRCGVGLTPHGEILTTLAAEFSDSIGHESVPIGAHVDFSEVKSETLEVEYDDGNRDSDQEEDAQTETSDEWCVMDREEQDAELFMKLKEEELVVQTYEQVPADAGDVSGPAKEFVDDSSTEETSAERRISTVACTSSIVLDYDVFYFLM